MKLTLTPLKLPAVISSALVLPFLFLELVNRRGYHEDFPLPLFGILWLLPMVFTLLLRPIVHEAQADTRTTPATISLLLGLALLILIAWFWVGIIIDQMPCFLGMPLCD